MMTSAGAERMRAVRARYAARRTVHDRRTFVVRLVGQLPRCGDPFILLPGALEFGPVAFRRVGLQKLAVRLNALGDELVRGFDEDRAPLLAVGVQQRVASPPLELGRELPAEIGDVV